MAAETIRQYGRLQVDSDVLRSKLYSILLPAYTLLGERKEREKLIGTIRHLLPLVHAEQARANLLVTLYGCADSSLDYERGPRDRRTMEKGRISQEKQGASDPVAGRLRPLAGPLSAACFYTLVYA